CFFATLHGARHTRHTVAKSAKKRFASDFWQFVPIIRAFVPRRDAPAVFSDCPAAANPRPFPDTYFQLVGSGIRLRDRIRTRRSDRVLPMTDASGKYGVGQALGASLKDPAFHPVQ